MCWPQECPHGKLAAGTAGWPDLSCCLCHLALCSRLLTLLKHSFHPDMPPKNPQLCRQGVCGLICMHFCPSQRGWSTGHKPTQGVERATADNVPFGILRGWQACTPSSAPEHGGLVAGGQAGSRPSIPGEALRGLQPLPVGRIL